jgi:hypothetical protein
VHLLRARCSRQALDAEAEAIADTRGGMFWGEPVARAVEGAAAPAPVG